MSYCDNVEVTNSKICKCRSENGFVIGLGLFNNTHDCNIDDLSISNLSVENSYETEYPNIKPTVYDGYIDPTSYYNNITLAKKKQIIDKDKNNKLSYYCGKCNKKHLI